jgi:hypothetical protein
VIIYRQTDRHTDRQTDTQTESPLVEVPQPIGYQSFGTETLDMTSGRMGEMFEGDFEDNGSTACLIFPLFTTSISLGKGRGQHAAIKRKVVVVARGQCLEI